MMCPHLYIHIPFCPKVCPYCSFYKEASDRNKTQGFLDAVLRELDTFQERNGLLKPETIFFGGGTPSALTVKQLEYLLAGLQQRLDLSNLKEWTLEMNPATVSVEKARVLQDLGVTRISMGVQSWDEEVLQTLGRVHTGAQAERSYEILREAGFDNVNMDLMFAVPGQTTHSLSLSIRKMIALRPEHVSAYCLTYEEDTEFLRRFESGLYTRGEEEEAVMFETAMALLEENGFEHYEISNYCRPGKECLHNMGYWQGANYLGLGPSAWSTIGSERWRNVPNTVEYVTQVHASGQARDIQEDIDEKIRVSERLAFGIRTNRGIQLADARRYWAEVQPLLKEGILCVTNEDTVMLTRRGFLIADSVAEIFVSD